MLSVCPAPTWLPVILVLYAVCLSSSHLARLPVVLMLYAVCLSSSHLAACRPDVICCLSVQLPLGCLLYAVCLSSSHLAACRPGVICCLSVQLPLGCLLYAVCLSSSHLAACRPCVICCRSVQLPLGCLSSSCYMLSVCPAPTWLPVVLVLYAVCLSSSHLAACHPCVICCLSVQLPLGPAACRPRVRHRDGRLRRPPSSLRLRLGSPQYGEVPGPSVHSVPRERHRPGQHRS